MFRRRSPDSLQRLKHGLKAASRHAHVHALLSFPFASFLVSASLKCLFTAASSRLSQPPTLVVGVEHEKKGQERRKQRPFAADSSCCRCCYCFCNHHCHPLPPCVLSSAESRLQLLCCSASVITAAAVNLDRNPCPFNCRNPVRLALCTAALRDAAATEAGAGGTSRARHQPQ